MDPATELMIEALGEDILDFVQAIIEHLTSVGSADQRAAVAVRVVSLLSPELDEEDAAAELLNAPEILASFFQNADLLPADGESGRRIARVVALALERAWEE